MVGILQQSTHDIDGALYGPWMLSLGRRTQKVKLRLFSLEQGAYLFGKPVTDGRFTLESTYASISSQSGQANPLFKVVWRWSGPERTRILLWKTAQQALVTNDFRAKKGMSLSNACHVCDVASENAVHCFRDCPHAIQISNIHGDDEHGFNMHAVAGIEL
ncbi:hypothetical protein JHK87_032161 [Glycine soja]|nr:hypothetical protein JHK87_032161 [Glycine soja]